MARVNKPGDANSNAKDADQKPGDSGAGAGGAQAKNDPEPTAEELKAALEEANRRAEAAEQKAERLKHSAAQVVEAVSAVGDPTPVDEAGQPTHAYDLWHNRMKHDVFLTTPKRVKIAPGETVRIFRTYRRAIEKMRGYEPDRPHPDKKQAEQGHTIAGEPFLQRVDEAGKSLEG